MASTIFEEDSRIGVAITLAELDVESPVRSSVSVQGSQQMEQESITTAAQVVMDPPAGYVELPADPAPCAAPTTESTERPQLDEPEAAGPQGPQTKQFKPYRSMGDPTLVASKTTERQRSSSLQPCSESPAALEKGRLKGPPRAATWSEEPPKEAGLATKRFGFGSGWLSATNLTETTLSEWQTASRTDLSTTCGSSTPTTISPLSPANIQSSETSLPARDVPDPNQLPQRQKTISPIPASPTSPEPNLPPRKSSSNMSQLLARHALLESRRRILLQLQEIDQEQEQILEKLATMSEE